MLALLALPVKAPDMTIITLDDLRDTSGALLGGLA